MPEIAATTHSASTPRTATAGWEVLALFLRLGCVALGGPTAHIALMHREIVERRGWLTDREFMDLLAASYLIPGPNSTMMAMNLGFVRARNLGVWIAGLCFIIPGMLLALGLAVSYARFSEVPEVRGAFWGIHAIVLALIVDALSRLAPRAVTSLLTAGLFIAGLVGALLGVGTLVLVGVAGALGLFRASRPGGHVPTAPTVMLAGLTALARPIATVNDGDGVRLAQIGWVFLKIALILFDGSLFIGYVKGDVVDKHGWLTDQQLLDAVALGQATPGPVMKSATIIGYMAAGLPGAAVATVAIFLPSFVFAMILGRWMLSHSRRATFSMVLSFMLPVVVAMMVMVTADIARDTVHHPLQVAMAAVTFVAFRFRVIDSVALLVTGAGLGLLYSLI